MEIPAEPVLAVARRGGVAESWHRGSWVLADVEGRVIDHRGSPDRAIFARSATKSLQALPLLETGAADRFGVSDDELAVVVASHHGEPLHLRAVASLLARAGLDETHLRCGPRPTPGIAAVSGPTAIEDNCSGKHAGFLVTAVALGDDPAGYLEAGSGVQRLVYAAVVDMSDADGALSTAVDGCGAPTFNLPLRSLATAIARMANPDSLPPARAAACHRITRATAAYPAMVGGMSGSLDSDLMRIAPDRIFAKGGAEGVYVVGLRGRGLGLALKIDDGTSRGLHRLVPALLARLGTLDQAELEALGQWVDPVLRNRSGIAVGDVMVPDDMVPA